MHLPEKVAQNYYEIHTNAQHERESSVKKIYTSSQMEINSLKEMIKVFEKNTIDSLDESTYKKAGKQ